jgi:hypothetical protein
MLAIIVSIVVALPTLAVAQYGNNQHRPPPGKGPPGRPAVGRPGFVPGRPVGPVVGRPVGPVVGGPRGPGRQFSYHGHFFNPVHLAPFVYPPGWAYRRWAVGGVLPPLFLAPAYYYAEWATLGLTAPPPGFQWVRYGPDLLLVNVTTGQVADVAYGVFY